MTRAIQPSSPCASRGLPCRPSFALHIPFSYAFSFVSSLHLSLSPLILDSRCCVASLCNSVRGSSCLTLSITAPGAFQMTRLFTGTAHRSLSIDVAEGCIEENMVDWTWSRVSTKWIMKPHVRRRESNPGPMHLSDQSWNLCLNYNYPTRRTEGRRLLRPDTADMVSYIIFDYHPPLTFPTVNWPDIVTPL